MQNVLKPFAAKVTDSLNGPFQRARIVLTFVYVMILLGILFSSSSFTYSTFSRQLTHRFEHYEVRPPIPNWPISSELVNGVVVMPNPADLRTDLIDALIIVNGILLVTAGVLSYWLAGLTLRPVQTAYNRQRQFLSDASHELRTPLAILQTDLENQLGAKDVTPIAREQLVSHLEEVERMSNLVRGLLELSRLDEGATLTESNGYSLELVAINQIATQAVERLMQRAAQAGVTLRLVTEAGADQVLCKVNRELLLQALSNVIMNAIVYNKPAGEITVSTTTDRQHITLRVQDTGVGMTAEDAAQVFTRFYRAEKSRSRKTGGSGLGLSIAQSIIQKFDGTIALTSELGVGTTVSVTLPVHKAS